MYLCYVDESGTPEVPGNSRHFVLAGLSMPIWHWRDADQQITNLATRYGLERAEIHTAWLLRGYLEQRKIPDFEKLSRIERRSAVMRERAGNLLQMQRGKNSKAYSQVKKNYKHTEDYIHLTHEERVEFIVEIAYTIKSWGFATLFAECIDKLHFDQGRVGRAIDEQAFEQIISRFEQYIVRTNPDNTVKGIVVHDNNQTVAKKHTDLMRAFHSRGTLWIKINRIIETPMFVDSKLTSMVQMADLCSYAIRRYLENGERHLFDIIFSRGDKIGQRTVGMRHFTNLQCACEICKAHRPHSTAA